MKTQNRKLRMTMNRRRLMQWMGGTASAALLPHARALSFQQAERQGNAEGSLERGPFQPNWESLKHYKAPDWFRDAKFLGPIGLRVPDDVTLLLSDDNWGDLRRLPTPEERNRSGGAGIYYHFDYVGGPRNYKWLNTNYIPKIWEQMNLALNYGADRIWVVNVGDLKPMEFPIEFFLSMARTPKRWDKDHLEEFTRDWAAREFGEEHAAEIASAMDDYTRYNARRKPELIDSATFSPTNYGEADRVDRDWRDLSARVDKLATELPEDERASFLELVQYSVDASATVTEMYIAAGRNSLDARLGHAQANDDAAETRRLLAKDAELSDEYNHNLLNGRWNHMMDQTHIGYTTWQEPPLNAMPAVTEVQGDRKSTRLNSSH